MGLEIPVKVDRNHDRCSALSESFRVDRINVSVPWSFLSPVFDYFRYVATEGAFRFCSCFVARTDARSSALVDSLGYNYEA